MPDNIVHEQYKGAQDTLPCVDLVGGNKLVTDEMTVMYMVQQRFQKDLISSSWGSLARLQRGCEAYTN